jgi:hypothetical protein
MKEFDLQDIQASLNQIKQGQDRTNQLLEYILEELKKCK